MRPTTPFAQRQLGWDPAPIVTLSAEILIIEKGWMMEGILNISSFL